MIELMLEDLDMKHLTAKMLHAFIHVQTFSTVDKPKGFSWPNKGNKYLAQAGVWCLILLAHECCNIPEKLLNEPTLPEPPTRPPSRHLSASILSSTGANKFDSADHIHASTLLQNSSWHECVLNVLRLNAENQQQIGEYEQMQASLLQKLLLKCLESHVAKKVNTDKQNNWCLYFTASKLGHMAAIMVLLGHVKHDLGCIQSDMCLLAGLSTF
jgi:hypothetical protein